MTTNNTNKLYPGRKALTYKEAYELDAQCAELGWGLTMSDALAYVREHMIGCIHDREVIEYILTECNYHTLCKLLKENKYADALRELANDYE